MKKYIFAFSLTLFIIFNSFMPNIVYANSLASVPTSSILDGAKCLVPILTPFAPQIALVAVVCIGAGIVFENREEVATVAGGIYQHMKTAGVSATVAATGALSFGAEALKFVNDDIASLYSTNTITATYPTGVGVREYASPRSATGLHITEGCSITFTSEGIIHLIPFSSSTTDFLIGFGTMMGMEHYIPYVIDTILYSGVYFPIDLAKPLSVYFPKSIEDASICVDVPAGMTSTPSVTAPYAADTALNIPADSTLTGDSTVAGSATSTWEDTLIGETDWTKPFDKTGAIPIDPPIDVPIDVPINPPIDAPLDWSLPSSVALDFSPIQNVGVSNKFPFCIPYDLINSFKSFNKGSSIAPKFDIDMTKWKGGSHYIIDFAMFDKLAIVIRWGILLIFNLGLIMLTRNILRG